MRALSLIESENFAHSVGADAEARMTAITHRCGMRPRCRDAVHDRGDCGPRRTSSVLCHLMGLSTPPPVDPHCPSTRDVMEVVSTTFPSRRVVTRSMCPPLLDRARISNLEPTPSPRDDRCTRTAINDPLRVLDRDRTQLSSTLHDLRAIPKSISSPTEKAQTPPIIESSQLSPSVGPEWASGLDIRLG